MAQYIKKCFKKSIEWKTKVSGSPHSNEIHWEKSNAKTIQTNLDHSWEHGVHCNLHQVWKDN